MSRVQVIRQSLAAIGGKTYMEIGVFDGSTFALVDAALKIAIDPLPPAPLFLKDPIVHLRSTRSDLRVFVLNSDFGLGIVCYGKPENLLSFTPEAIEAMSYWDLADNRAAFLNLKSFDSFDDFISNYPFNVKI
jgi:hypothetical protein